MTYWAHSDPDGQAPEHPGSRWQRLSEHLQQVANLSRRLAASAAPGFVHFHDLAEWCGLLHDYGKYTDCFQGMILGRGKGPCPHAMHGTVLAYDKLQAPHVASAIVGHHAGMPDLGELRDKAGKSRSDALELLKRAERDFPALSSFLGAAHPLEKIGKDRFDLLTRMLLSCLVDACGRSNSSLPRGSDTGCPSRCRSEYVPTFGGLRRQICHSYFRVIRSSIIMRSCPPLPIMKWR